MKNVSFILWKKKYKLFGQPNISVTAVIALEGILTSTGNLPWTEGISASISSPEQAECCHRLLFPVLDVYINKLIQHVLFGFWIFPSG